MASRSDSTPRILIVSTPAGPIGSGVGGGLETTLILLTRELNRRGIAVATLAPEGSVGLSGQVIEVAGTCAVSVTQVDRGHVQPVSPEGFLERAWERAASIQDQYDAILNCSYDWISFYAAAFFRIPVLHWISVAALVDSVDRMMEIRYRQEPGSFAFYSRAQAASFAFVECGAVRIIPGAVDLERFGWVEKPEPRLSWCARISPEKGLEDAIAAAETLGLPLDVCGTVEDHEYWRRCRAQAGPSVTHHGFLSHDALASVLGRSQAMLFTPKWTEAFGMVALEAMACGTPVVAYAGGGPSEVIEHGVSGFLVERGDIAALAHYAGLAAELGRRAVRARAERFSVGAQAERIERWIEEIRATGRGLR
ncbi:MAG TPA: glycosyltransferase [Bryobacteraceae bacterium]|nr:glycosyltransferase [Bryobacteraceae bacterium]